MLTDGVYLGCISAPPSHSVVGCGLYLSVPNPCCPPTLSHPLQPFPLPPLTPHPPLPPSTLPSSPSHTTHPPCPRKPHASSCTLLAVLSVCAPSSHLLTLVVLAQAPPLPSVSPPLLHLPLSPAVFLAPLLSPSPMHIACPASSPRPYLLTLSTPVYSTPSMLVARRLEHH